MSYKRGVLIKKNIILFFNKEDIFKKKIQNTDLNVCWEEYKDGKKYDPALKFIIKKISKFQPEQKKRNYPLFNNSN